MLTRLRLDMTLSQDRKQTPGRLTKKCTTIFATYVAKELAAQYTSPATSQTKSYSLGPPGRLQLQRQPRVDLQHRQLRIHPHSLTGQSVGLQNHLLPLLQLRNP